MGLFHSESRNNQHYPSFFFLLDIQCLGLSLLRSLITRKSLCIATMHVLSTVLVSTLRRFKEVTEIQMHVCVISIYKGESQRENFRKLFKCSYI